MNWIATNSSDKPIKIKLPDRIPHGVPFPAVIDGSEAVVIWNRQRRVLTWLQDGVEQNFELIQTTTARVPNDSQRTIGLQFGNSVQRLSQLTGKVDVDSPGREHRRAAKAAAGHEVRSPITGKVLAVKVENGQAVKSGDTVVIIEAMKMENKIFAPDDGIVKDLSVAAGDAVASGALLLNIGAAK